MAFSTIQMNITALDNITSPNINVGDSTLTSIIGLAQTSTHDYLIFGTLFIISSILYLVLTDSTPYQDFGYDYIRGLNIAFASSALIGLNMVEVGWSNNFYAVGVFVVLWFLTYIGILIIENQE